MLWQRRTFLACAEAFDKLERALVSAPFLTYPNFREPFLVFVDASSTSIGFTSAQIQNGKEVVIAYNGRGLNQAEQNYSTKRQCWRYCSQTSFFSLSKTSSKTGSLAKKYTTPTILLLFHGFAFQAAWMYFCQ